MIRVLHIVNCMNRGGLETFIMNVYRSIDRSKLQFDFLVHVDREGAFDNEISTLGGKIFYVSPRNQGILKNHKTLDKFFKAHPEYKIVHQHVSSLSYIEPLKVAKIHGVPIRIVHAHSTQEGGSTLHKYIHLWNRIFIKSYATHYFACSDFAARWLLGKKMFEDGEYKIIKNGIETSKYRYNFAKRIEIRKALGINNKFVLGHVGGFSYAKNHTFLIDLFKHICETSSDFVMLLIGDGQLRENIEAKIDSYGLKNSIIMTGVRDDVPDLLQAMDIFIFPSYYEGLPVALIEAQASGLPCLVSDSITRQVKVTNNVEYINLSSPIYYWVSKINEIKRHYKRQDQSKQVIDKGFDIKKIAQHLQELYQELYQDSKG